MNEIRNDTLIIHGDVDSANGDVDYYGKVTVEGSILSGMTVKSTDDMIIKGDVNGGHVNCIGHLLITGGIDGENRSKVVAQKDIKVNFIRNATVKSESGSVYVDADISDSSVVAKRKVVLGAEDAMSLMSEEVEQQIRGSLKSGVIKVGDELVTNFLGTKEKSDVEIIVVSDSLREKIFATLALEKRISGMREEFEGLSKMLNLIKVLGKNIVNLPDAKKIELKRQSDQYFQLKNELQALTAQKSVFEQECVEIAEKNKKKLVVKVNNEIFPGVKITIDQISFSVPSHEKRVCFYKSGIIIMGKLDRIIGGINDEQRIG